MPKIQIILGSTRQNRLGVKIAQWIFNEFKKNNNIESELIDLRDWPLPFFDEPTSPAMNNGNYSLELAKKWAEKIGEADGYILVTPEYNHSFSAVLKNALDYVYKEWNKKPAAFVSYGGLGGARAVEQLRIVVSALDMNPVRESVQIPGIWKLIDEKGNIDLNGYSDSAEAMIKELLWWTSALKTQREKK